MKKKLLILVLSGFLISCASTGVKGVTEPNSINEKSIQSEFIGTTWKLSKYISDGELKDVISTSKADLKFEDGKFYGDASVNRYFGSYTLDNGKLAMGRVGTTMMMGPNDAMEQEYIFTRLLEKVTSYEIVGEELKLFSDEKLILVLNATKEVK